MARYTWRTPFRYLMGYKGEVAEPSSPPITVKRLPKPPTVMRLMWDGEADVSVADPLGFVTKAWGEVSDDIYCSILTAHGNALDYMHDIDAPPFGISATAIRLQRNSKYCIVMATVNYSYLTEDKVQWSEQMAPVIYLPNTLPHGWVCVNTSGGLTPMANSVINSLLLMIGVQLDTITIGKEGVYVQFKVPYGHPMPDVESVSAAVNEVLAEG